MSALQVFLLMGAANLLILELAVSFKLFAKVNPHD